MIYSGKGDIKHVIEHAKMLHSKQHMLDFVKRWMLSTPQCPPRSGLLFLPTKLWGRCRHKSWHWEK